MVQCRQLHRTLRTQARSERVPLASADNQLLGLPAVLALA